MHFFTIAPTLQSTVLSGSLRYSTKADDEKELRLQNKREADRQLRVGETTELRELRLGRMREVRRRRVPDRTCICRP